MIQAKEEQQSLARNSANPFWSEVLNHFNKWGSSLAAIGMVDVVAYATPAVAPIVTVIARCGVVFAAIYITAVIVHSNNARRVTELAIGNQHSYRDAVTAPPH